MSTPPALTTYVRVTGAADHKWIAQFDCLTMAFKASSEQEVIATAQQWWAEQVSQLADRQDRLAKARAARKLRAA